MVDTIAGLPALWRRRDEDNGEAHTDFDKGYEQASDECADTLERAIAALEASPGVVVTEEMIDCALRLLPNLPRVCMQVALEDALAAAPTPSDAVDKRSTHHVHRGPESLPCYCAGTSDHPIGSETATQDDPAPSVAAIERFTLDVGFEGTLPYGDTREEPDGELVRYADHARIVAEKDAEIALLRSDAERIASCPWRVQKGATAMCQPPKNLRAALDRADALAGVLRDLTVTIGRIGWPAHYTASDATEAIEAMLRDALLSEAGKSGPAALG